MQDDDEEIRSISVGIFSLESAKKLTQMSRDAKMQYIVESDIDLDSMHEHDTSHDHRHTVSHDGLLARLRYSSLLIYCGQIDTDTCEPHGLGAVVSNSLISYVGVCVIR